MRSAARLLSLSLSLAIFDFITQRDKEEIKKIDDLVVTGLVLGARVCATRLALPNRLVSPPPLIVRVN